jgi:hypothetical protein
METDLIYTFGPYDFEVDTTNAVPARSPQLYRPPGEPGPAGEPCGRAYLVTGNLNPYLSLSALLAANECALTVRRLRISMQNQRRPLAAAGPQGR